MTEGANTRVLTLAKGQPTPADLYYNGAPLSHHLGWPETLACLDRALARLFDYFRQGQDRPDATDLDIFLFEGGWVYAKRDGLAGPILWLFLLEQAKAAGDLITQVELTPGHHVPAEFLTALRDEAGLATPDPAHFPAGASAQLRDPRDRNGKWRWLLRSALRVATSRPDPRLRQTPRGTLLISTASLTKHRYGTLIDDLRRAQTDGQTLLGVHPKERPWASDAGYEKDVLSLHRGGGLVTVLRAAWSALRLLRRHRYLSKALVRTDPMLSAMLTYRYPHLFHAILHALCVEKLLRRASPAAFIRNGNYNTPDERRTNWACRRAGVPSIVVTPRNLSPRMPAMPMEYPREKASLATGFVIGDQNSRQTLRDWGVPDAQIALGALEVMVEETAPETGPPHAAAPQDKPTVLILIDSYPISQQMMREILPALPREKVRLQIRAHPLLPLDTQPKVVEALEEWDWEDVTGVLMRKVVRTDRTLAISPCSGAGIDAVRCGAAVAWVPYLSSNAPAHIDAITSTGDICEGPGHLTEHLSVLMDPEGLAQRARLHRRRLQEAITPTQTPLVDAVQSLIAAQTS